MLVNLASTSAASVFAASPRPGVTGTLPVTRGGTGVTTLDALKTSLDINPDKITYFSKSITATSRNREVSETISISGTIKFVALLTCYYSGGYGLDVDYRPAFPSQMVDAHIDVWAPLSNIFVPGDSAELATCASDSSISSNLGMGFVGPSFQRGWGAGKINVATDNIIITAYAASGSSSSSRSNGTAIFSGLILYI